MLDALFVQADFGVQCFQKLSTFYGSVFLSDTLLHGQIELQMTELLNEHIMCALTIIVTRFQWKALEHGLYPTLESESFPQLDDLRFEQAHSDLHAGFPASFLDIEDTLDGPRVVIHEFRAIE